MHAEYACVRVRLYNDAAAAKARNPIGVAGQEGHDDDDDDAARAAPRVGCNAPNAPRSFKR